MVSGTAPNPQGIFPAYLEKKAWRPDGFWDPDRKAGVVEGCSVSDCLC